MSRVSGLRREVVRYTSLAFLAGSAWGLSPSMAHASTAAEQGAAEVLFREGLDLMQQGKFVEACPKLARSQQLEPAVGTQYKLAECEENVGKLASAWLNFTAVADKLAEKGDKEKVREKKARSRATALLPRLSRLEVSVDEDRPGLRVTVDDQELAKSTWGVAVPIDGGDHVVRAEAPNYRPFTATVHVQAERDSATLRVRPLEPDPSADAAAKATPAPATPGVATSPPSTTTAGPIDQAPRTTSGSTWLRPTGWVLGGLGVAGVVVTGVLAGVSSSKWSGASDQCTGNVCTTQDAIDQRKDAIGLSDAATVVGISSVVLLGASAAILLFGPSNTSSSAAPRVALTPGGVTFAGSF